MTILPGSCCYGNAAIAMIGHSCLINWFFNASWFVRTFKEQVHGKWEINGFLFLHPVFAEPISSCFMKCTAGVLNYDWKSEIAVDGEIRARLFEMQRERLCWRQAFVSSC